MTELQYYILLILFISIVKLLFTLYKSRNVTFWNFEEIERDIMYYGWAISTSLIIFVISFIV